MIKFFPFLLLFFFTPIQAQTCGTSCRVNVAGTLSESFPTCAAAVSSMAWRYTAVSVTPTNCPTPTTTGPGTCDIIISQPHGDFPSQTTSFTYVLEDCPEPDCPIGELKTVNYTLGWAPSTFNGTTSDDIIELPNAVPLSGDMNDGTCIGVLSGVTGCFVSTEPAPNGLFRVSCDYDMLITGSSSGPADPNSDPSTPPPSCPGGSGTVNGKAVCLLEPNTSLKPFVPEGTSSSGNPSSGPKPNSGEGSGTGGPGRTPSTGDGGNAGGPSSSAEGESPAAKYGDDSTEPNPEDSSLCKLYPDSLACQKITPPAPENIPTQNRDIAFQSGPTFSGSSCPPDVVVNVAGRSVTVLDTSQACGWIESYMRPIILLLAAISAAFIVLPRES